MAEILLPDGRRLAYSRSGAGRPLVLLHGWCMSRAVFREFLERPPAGCQVVAFDLPGHGASDPAAGASLADWVRDLAAAIELLRLQRPVLCGWSLGGMLCLQLAVQAGCSAAALVLIGTTPRFVNGDGWQVGVPPARLAAMRRDVRRSYRPAMERFYRMMFAENELAPAEYRRIARFAAGPGSLPPQPVAEAGLRILAQDDLRSLLPEVRMPVLVLHGRQDAVIPFASGEELAAALPQARLVAFDETGHAPFLSRPEQVRQELEGFLACLPPS
ncbi:pimeloyl-[acyl-carrier protein] methyl ester esterase [Geothermobacter ehrlichii]|uniref:Pimeloyl-[acyl-carrier protein] methyl ester esterase n=1 Tax=Geothermobacter ehrlichii TaxID=213224 RepID=A0A5D3WKX8_9BACT|nr:alpha/beta fold hydrolase [Geothermobacter ehrlichii]TYO98760.1 pimeloyl-[acyl-carrier protein] methyl ester esterase [Geothermobacter ehrlichii]